MANLDKKIEIGRGLFRKLRDFVKKDSPLYKLDQEMGDLPFGSINNDLSEEAAKTNAWAARNGLIHDDEWRYGGSWDASKFGKYPRVREWLIPCEKNVGGPEWDLCVDVTNKLEDYLNNSVVDAWMLPTKLSGPVSFGERAGAKDAKKDLLKDFFKRKTLQDRILKQKGPLMKKYEEETGNAAQSLKDSWITPPVKKRTEDMFNQIMKTHDYVALDPIMYADSEDAAERYIARSLLSESQATQEGLLQALAADKDTYWDGVSNLDKLYPPSYLEKAAPRWGYDNMTTILHGDN